MIRGAIEVAQKTRVAGWLYSATDPLRDKTVLAFVGARCVGAGKVDRFRQDLLDAKLGDGYCGYDFPVRLADGESAGAVIVRLQFSDMALIQTASRVSGLDDQAIEAAELGAIPPASVSWMMDRGMLDQPEYDFMRCVQTAGAYERGLRAGKRGAGPDGGPARLDPETTARDMLALLLLSDARVIRTALGAISELVANPAVLRRAGAPVAALWSAERGCILLEERSHLAGRAADGPVGEPQPGSIEYSFGPDRLLFVHRDCRFAAHGPAPASGITLFTVATANGAATTQKKPAHVKAA